MINCGEQFEGIIKIGLNNYLDKEIILIVSFSCNSVVYKQNDYLVRFWTT